ncbi:cell division protein PerM [Plantactinospora sonchi]|uniref:cell division protein PerM n=1 Tax=Plantactinospora sonchi TaxID=1544735 RepID=UPI0038B5DC6A
MPTPRPGDDPGDVPRPRERRPSGRAPLPVAAAVATLWAAVVSYLPVALVLGGARFAEDAGSFGAAARLGLAGWLLGHGVPLQTDAGPFGLAPLALAMFAAWRLARAGVHVSRAIGARHHPTLGRAFVVAAAVGTGYGVLGGLAALALGGDGPTAAPLRALLTLAAFGALAALVGALRTTGALGSLARRTPPVLRDGVRAGVVAAFLLFAAGAGVAGLAVATGGGEAGDMIGAYRTGVVGQAGITLVSLGYAPNAAIWAVSFLLGPGFAVGTDTVVRTTEVSIGALPAVPLFAALPEGPLGGVGGAVLAVPVLAGMGAGWLLARRMVLSAAVRQAPPPGWANLLGAAAVGGPVAGMLMGGAAFFSGGPLGSGRLAEIGPSYWQVAAGATVVVLVGTLIGAVASRVVTRA